jgi:ceramide glucosyltransferase
VALVWAAVLMWLAIGAVIRRAQLQRRLRRAGPGELAGRSVLLIRPCAGAEPGLAESLGSAATLRTSADLTIVMCVDDERDTAIPVIEATLGRLQAAGIDARFELLEPLGPNRKASMLARLLARDGASARPHELIVNVDSNVDLSEFALDDLLVPLLREAELGAAWVPVTEVRTRSGLGPRASEAVLGASLTAFPLLCGIYAFGLVGKLWAAKHEALRACDFETLPLYLGEDLEMANRLRRAGWGIAAVPLLARVHGHAPSFAEVVGRFGRWMLATRSARPALMLTYPLFFFATGSVLVLVAFGTVAAPTISLVAAGLAVGARLVVSLAAQYWSGHRIGPLRGLGQAVIGDLALALAWLRGYAGRDVVWRGHRLRVEANGRLSSLDRRDLQV